MKKELIIFDFDGTIANTMAVAVDIINSLGIEFGFPQVDEDELRLLRDKTIPELMKISGLSWLQLPLFVKRVRDKFRESLDEVEPISQMPEVIRALHEQGFQLGILTSNTEEGVQAFLKNYELELFEFIRAPDSIFGKSKSLKDIRKTYKLKRKDIVMIGDEGRDIEAAQKAKMDAVAVSWGFNSRQLLETHQPDLIVDKPEELLNLFELKED